MLSQLLEHSFSVISACRTPVDFCTQGRGWEQVEDMSERFPDEEKTELEKMRLSRENLSGR